MAPKTNETPNKKFDLSGIISAVQKDNKKLAKKVGVGTHLKPLEDKDFLKLGYWFEQGTGLKGIAFGRITLISGDSDTGKTSFAIQCMKAAQQQNAITIFSDSENKTTSKDFECWGVDPSQVLSCKSTITEELLELTKQTLNKTLAEFPNEKVLVVIDSIGNNVSQHDLEIDLTVDNQQVGGKSKTIRLALNQMIAIVEQNPNVAILLVSYNYDTMPLYGASTKVPVGGKSLKFFSSLVFYTSRKGWLERVEKGEKIRYGAEVIFKLDKNHLTRENQGKKQITFRITKEGMSCAEVLDSD